MGIFNKREKGIGRVVEIGDKPPISRKEDNIINKQSAPQPYMASTTVVRKTQPGQKVEIEILSIDKLSKNPNINTMIIKCPNNSVLTRVKNMIARYGRKSTTSYINNRLTIDIYINISPLSPDIIDPHKYRGNKCLSVVYELSEDGECYAINRFPDALLVTVGETTGIPQLTIDKLFGGAM